METKLTDEQLQEFLDELQEVENLSPEEQEDIKNNDAWGWGQNTDKVTVENYTPALMAVKRSQSRADAKKRNTDKAAKRKELIKQITEEAINDEFIDLNAPLDVWHKKLIIKQRTAKYKVTINNNASLIKNSVEHALWPLYPSKMRSVWKHNKDSMVPAPSFTWKTFNNKYEYKITPDLPFYFKPEDCQGLIIESNPGDANRIDAAIERFFYNNDAVVKLEVSIAQQLVHMMTFFDLLKKKPEWYRDFVEELKKQ